MWLLVIAFTAMLFEDALAALYNRWLAARHPWRAGAADGTSDVGALLSVGVTGAAVGRHGVSLWSAAAICLIWFASVLGTVLGAELDGAFEVLAGAHKPKWRAVPVLVWFRRRAPRLRRFRRGGTDPLPLEETE